MNNKNAHIARIKTKIYIYIIEWIYYISVKLKFLDFGSVQKSLVLGT